MKYIAMTIAVALAIASGAFGASLHTVVQDASPALKMYNGSTETLAVTIQTAGAGAANTFVLGSTTNTLDGSADTDTIAEWVAAIAAFTNSAGSTFGSVGIVVDSDCSLSTDSTDGDLLSGTYTATAGNWLTIPYDTSGCKFYQIYFPDQEGRGGDVANNFTLSKIVGSPGGTSNVTTAVYLDGTLVWQRIDQTSATSEIVNLDVSPALPVKASQACIVRATRTTTATTGVLGVVAE